MKKNLVLDKWQFPKSITSLKVIFILILMGLICFSVYAGRLQV